MKKLINKNLKNNSGFTLIEMVVVVAILGILSSVSITKYGKAQESAKLNADYVSAANIATAVNLAINDGLDMKLNEEFEISDLSVLKGEYLQEVPISQSEENGVFIVKVDKSEVTVFLGENKLYPKSTESK